MKYPMLQDPEELASFIQLIRDNGVKSFLEVGSKFGGTLWSISNTLPKGSRIVSVDLPQGGNSQPHLERCVSELRALGYDIHLLFGDSTDQRIIDAVRGLGPFDLIFIDANHTEPYVWKDWNNYKQMTKMIAFHDIGFRQLPHKRIEQIHVPVVWEQIKKDRRYVEFKNCKASNGIGVIWL